jgi:hypothetical protein
MALNNKTYIDVIDFRQDFFEIDKKTKNPRGFLYEFNFKSANDSLTTDKIDEYLSHFGEFSEFVRGKKYTVHFTGLKTEDDKNKFDYFKLIIGLTVQRTLSEVEDDVNKANMGFFTDKDVTLLSKRIVKNKSKVSSEDYFDYLNKYLEEEFPQYMKRQETYY